MNTIAPAGNPFALLTLDTSRYYGSTHILHLALQAMGGSYPAALEIIGLSGMGKTSLLRYLAALPKRDVEGDHEMEPSIKDDLSYFREPYKSEYWLLFPVLVEFSTKPLNDRPIVYIQQRFLEALRLLREAAIEKIPGLPEAPDLNQESTDDIAISIYHVLGLLSGSRIRTVFLLDDFDQVFNTPAGEDERHSFKDAEIQQMALWKQYASFILCTTQRLKDKNALGSKLFGNFTTNILNGLTSEEAERMITDTFSRNSLNIHTFPKEDIQCIFELSGRHPHLLIVAAKTLWEVREQFELLKTDTPLSGSQGQVLQDLITATYERRFLAYWNELSEEEKRTLQSLQKESPRRINDREAYPLLAKGLLSIQDGGEYQFFSTLFGEFVQKQAPPNPPAAPQQLLTHNEARLYEYLRENQGEISSYETLWIAVWGPPVGRSEEEIKRRIQVLASRLRIKLEAQGNEGLESVWNKGYRLGRR